MKHQHIAERCKHGETRRTLCDHPVPWSAYRVRQVPCAPAFCHLAGRAPSTAAAEAAPGYAFTALATVRLVTTAPDWAQAAARTRALEGEEHDVQFLRSLGFAPEAVTFCGASATELDPDE